MTDAISETETFTGATNAPADVHAASATAGMTGMLAPDSPGRRRSALRRALPELQRELAEVDALPEFNGRERSGLPVGDDVLLRKIGALSAWMGRHGGHPPAYGTGQTVYVRKVMDRIGHPGVDPTEPVRKAIQALGETHGFWAKDGRHVPELQIDRDLDRYENEIRTRGKGPPRSVGDPAQPCRTGCALEIPCDVRDLDFTCMKRLRRIMREAEKPGDIYHPTAADLEPSRNNKRNPAVATLLKAGLARYVDGLPADPLEPDEVDVITIAADCGISVPDIVLFGENVAAVREARGDRPLVPHPLLEERTYTYKDLSDHGREKRRDNPGGNADPGQASRASVAALTLFLGTRHAGGGLRRRVPLDFAKRVDRAIEDRPKEAGSGWMAEMRRWKVWNDGLRAGKPLPPSFALACRILCREAGVTVGELGRAVGAVGVVRQWLAGVAAPSIRHSPTVELMNDVLHMPRGFLEGLLSDEWRVRNFDEALFVLEDDTDADEGMRRRKRQSRHLPVEFADMPKEEREALLTHNQWAIVNQDTEFARRQSDMSLDEYILHEAKWPKALQDAWSVMIPKPRGSVLRRPGEIIAPVPENERRGRGKRKDKWRKPTIQHREALLGSITGYWTRPRRLDDEVLSRFQSRKTDYTPEAGLGIPLELLHPVLFVLPDLMSVFCHWRARRSGAEINTFVNALQLAAEFVRPETGPVWKDERMLEHLERLKEWWDANPHDTPEGPIVLNIEAFRRDWKSACEAAHAVLREDLHRVLGGKLPKSRDPFMSVDVFVSHSRPMELYMKGIRKMLASTPHTITSQHVHVRRSIQGLILVQTGLRTGTMLLTVSEQKPGSRLRNASGEEPELYKEEREDGTFVWKITIKAARFKNFDSPYFSEGRDYVATLENEDDLYALLDHYLTKSRPYMLRGRRSAALFVNKSGTDMNEEAMRREWHMITKLYFILNEANGTGAIEGAVSHGMHAARHVIATHIVKVEGDLRLAAFAIQDTVETAEKHYARFWPEDKVRIAAEVLKRARVAGRPSLHATPGRAASR